MDVNLARVRAFERVLPARMIADLRGQIVAAQRRRRSTGTAGTYWYSLAEPPRLQFEQVIQHLRSLVPRAHDFVGAEWWFRAVAPDTGFPFHFDRDEGIRSKIVSPDLASILYLSTAGGPTLLLDATPARGAAPKAALGVHPCPGRFAMFPGALLHGVLPSSPGRWPRVTLLVNWWRTVPRMERLRAPRDFAPASARGRIAGPATSAQRTVEAFEPSTLMARAAWLDIITGQTTYR